MPKTEKDRSFVTALARGLDILRCFDAPRAELTVSHIARRTGLSQPTAWRLCNTLLECGYLVPGSGAALRIGAPALALGYAAIQGLEFPEIARPYMQRLTQRMGCSTTLSLRRELEMVAVDRCDSDFVLPNQPIGWHAMLTSVSSGLAALCIMAAEDRAQSFAALEARDPSAWSRRRARVDAAIEEFERDGVVSFSGMLDNQYAAVAVPLIEPRPNAPRYWAISCGGLSARWTSERMAEAGQALIEVRTQLQPALNVVGVSSPPGRLS